MQYTESIPASLLRQFIFCPRIPYYNVLLNISEKKPIWMDQGLKFHNRLQLLLQRRSFKRFGLSNAQVSYNTSLYSKSFNLHGFADCLLLSENEVVPLEFKIEGNKLRKAHILQLLAYGYMAQEQFQKKFVKGFIIYGEKSNAVYQIKSSQAKEKYLRTTTDALLCSLHKMLKPASSASVHKCNQCNFLNHCNDRDI